MTSTFCSTVDDVELEVTRRSPRIRFVAPVGSASRRVTIAGQAGMGAEPVGAVVELRTEGEAELNRELWAKSCDELVRAVGFVISITYDPPAPAAVEAVSEPEPPPRAEVKPKPPSVTPVQAVPRQERGHDVGLDASPEAADLGLAADESRWRLGLGGSAAFGIAPSALWGGSAFAAMSWGPSYGAGGLVRIGVGGDVSSARGFAGGVAAFQRYTGELALGPEWHLGAVHFGAAAVGRAGLVRARGRSTIQPQSHDRPWAEAGAAVLGRTEFLQGWYLEAELAVSKPLTRYAFQFDPLVFHRVSSWLTHVGIAASAAF